ncbi:MAG: YHS domain-containing protein [Rhodospirillales bacterium]|nr:MAG: YHS domain-containing protein [Rhodospirillales bacterium]
MSYRPILAAALAALSLFAAATAMAEDPVSTGTFSNLAVSGYDPVAYFETGGPVEGQSAFEYQWNGAKWRFSSARNLAAFKADPETYAPQYGGYCAWAVSQGYTAKSDPTAWRIVDGKLYMNYSKDIQKRWEQDIPGNIAKADANWPRVLE